jgi:thioredoxin 1
MSIVHLKSVADLNAILAKSSDKLSVIDFHATWCGPCHAIAPTFKNLSDQYPHVNFLKCDVDEARDVATQYSIAAMPSFIFLKGTNQVALVKGANKSLLESTVKEHAGPSTGGTTGAFSGKGHTLGSSSSTSPGASGSQPHQGTKTLTQHWSGLDGNVKIFIGLLGAYVIFWWLS